MNLCFSLFLSLCLINTLPLSTAQAEVSSSFTYRLTVTGLENPELATVKNLFKAASLLEARRAETLVSIANLRGNLKSDGKLLTQILRSEGYYNSHVSDYLSRQGDHFEVDIRVTPGELYVLGKVAIAYQDTPPADDVHAALVNELALATGEPAKAADVVTAEARLISAFPEHGFPFAAKINRDVVVDHGTHTMNVTFTFDTGGHKRMGAVQFLGLTDVKENYLHKFYAWHEGDSFDQRAIESLRSRLIKTGLFSSIVVNVLKGDGERADVSVVLSETQHRTIGLSGGYSTAEGLGSEVSWEHHNIFKRGNHLKLAARAAEIEQSLLGRLEIPAFRRLDQTLSFNGSFRRQNTKAYFAHVAEAGVGIDRVITPQLAVFGRGAFEYSDVSDEQANRHFFLAALPVGVRWDSSDDLFDPSRGLRATLSTEPTLSVGQTHFSFLKSELRTSAYYSVTDDERLVLAARGRLGSLFGAGNETLPATRRFYAGGGGSVRGFAFQKVGPLDNDGNPLGGRSVAEIAAEARWKFSSTIGIVPFFEGGSVGDNTIPTLKDFRWAVGVGGRYHTSFAPIRFDIAFPIDRRAGEGRMQFYMSIGQAF